MDSDRIAQDHVSVHEAGHIVMAWLMEVPVLAAELGVCGGQVEFGSASVPFLLSLALESERRKLAKRLIRVAFAGRCAEQIFFGFSVGDKNSSDLLTAKKLGKIIGEPCDVPLIEEEVRATLVAHRNAIGQTAEVLKRKRKLSTNDLAIMQKEFQRSKEAPCLAA